MSSREDDTAVHNIAAGRCITVELDELLEFLEIEEPIEFEYFENFADMIECDDDISEDTMFQLFSQTDNAVVADIISHYFDDMLDAIPDDCTDMYVLVENIKRCLIGLIKAGEDESAMVHFSEELTKFKKWYCFESAVECENLDNGEKKVLPLRDALTLARLEKMENEDYKYDFTDCLDYELEDYIMGFADLADGEEEEASEDLLDNGYVYDDET